MKPYSEMTREELHYEKEKCESEFEAMKAMDLSLDMSRGKPCKEQLDLSNPMMDVLDSNCDLVDEVGVDCRNYGVFGGIHEAKRLMGEMSEVSPDSMLIFGNS